MIQLVNNKNDYHKLVSVWESAVKATHDFLTKEDYEFYKSQLIPSYFPQVDLYSFTDQNSNIIAFIGISEESLEMLFVANSHRRKGIGKALLNFAIKELNISKVDVNEQNIQAINFYKKAGFIESNRSETDSSGKPYPIISMII